MKTPRRKNQTPNSESGFSLLETTIALFVMLVGALACSSLFVFSLQNNIGGSERALAMAVAQQQLEKIRSVTYEDTTLNAGTTTATVSSGGRNYAVQRTIADANNSHKSPKQLKRNKIGRGQR